MGDRVTVKLTTLAVHYDQAMAIFEAGCGEPESDWTDGHLHVFEFTEVNYGNLHIESTLAEAGIAYDKHWQQGGDFDEGTEYLRFLDSGEVQKIEVETTSKNLPLDELMKRLDDHEALKAFIIDYRNKTTPLPWDDQERNGKRHLARQMISQ